MTTGVPSVTSQPGFVRQATTLTVSVFCTNLAPITPAHATTSADSTSTAFAITTPVIVRITHFKANAIVTSAFTICRICVLTSVDIMFFRCRYLPLRVLVTRPHHLSLLWELVTITVSTVRGSLLIDTTATRIDP